MNGRDKGLKCLIEDLHSDSSSDSDFHIEDEDLHEDSGDSNKDGASSESSSEGGEESESEGNSTTVVEDTSMHKPDRPRYRRFFPISKTPRQVSSKPPYIICCVCLSDKSEDTNEIIECDGCGETVHEACYGIKDSSSESSTHSNFATEPWFCDACCTDEKSVCCELCPNLGGLYKQTDIGQWIHAVCALYTPTVNFSSRAIALACEANEVGSCEKDAHDFDGLTLVNVNRWGERACELCEDQRYAYTGVVVNCDAGLCKSLFHVTCAQKAGLLEKDSEGGGADPYFAHCILHTDKAEMKERKKCWLALRNSVQNWPLRQKSARERRRITLGREEAKEKYTQARARSKYGRMAAPTRKCPRLLHTSAKVVRFFKLKQNLRMLNEDGYEMMDGIIASLQDVPKKWNLPVAYTPEYAAYVRDRETRANMLENKCGDMRHMVYSCREMHEPYNRAISVRERLRQWQDALENKRIFSWNFYRDLKLGERISSNSSSSSQSCTKRRSGHPAPKTPLKSVPVIHKCATCKQVTDQHLMAKCDSCLQYFHIGCLVPPLKRMPKKTKLAGWQCSNCNVSSNSEGECVEVEKPRKLRCSGQDRSWFVNSNQEIKQNEGGASTSFSGRTSGKCRRYSPEPFTVKKSGKRGRPKTSNGNDGVDHHSTPVKKSKISSSPAASENKKKNSRTPPMKSKKSVTLGKCEVCCGEGMESNMVQCDECRLFYHAKCLDPPCKTLPKAKGYGWQCTNCVSSP